VANGTQTSGPRAIRTHLRLGGAGVPRSRLTLRSTGKITRITGTVAGHRIRPREV
jgi:hypothetical protein